MFINPKQAISERWITGVTDPEKQVQPNAIDFSLDTLKLVDNTSLAFISESGKIMRPLDTMSIDADGNWILQGGRVYDGTSNMFVDVPEGVAAVLYTRSTFARNGVFIISGLYDSGYKGHIGFTIYTIGGPMRITPGTRIGQIGFMHADAAGKYAGGYNHQQGTHYAQESQATAGNAAANGIYPTGPDVGQKLIPSDPRRTETGMGPLLGTNSKFL